MSLAGACARGKARRLSELQDPTKAVERAYLCELFASPSHTALPAHMRAEQLFEILLAALEQVHTYGWSGTDKLMSAPFIRRGRVVEEPRVKRCGDAGAEAAEAEAADAAALYPPMVRLRYGGPFGRS